MPMQSVTTTAWWTAAIRAEENNRTDALFRDPFASRLSNASHIGIATVLRWGHPCAWAVVVRTFLFDWYITEQVRRGVDTVVNLGAGLDARPYRMKLPKSLHWIEVDHPKIIEHKESVLEGDRPCCAVERVPLDLTLSAGRRALFGLLGGMSRSVLVVSEGLVCYLIADEVGRLAVDLANQPRFRRWLLDLVSPEVLCLLRLASACQFGPIPEAFRFGPGQGADFFRRYGWRPLGVRSMLKTAVRVNRLPLMMRFSPALPVWIAAEGSGLWCSVCLLENERESEDRRNWH
jgi:methyltransferase (TIGR00027 family)